MTVAALITGLVALTPRRRNVLADCPRTRRTGHGLAIVVSLVAVWAFLVILMARDLSGSNLIDMVILGPTLLVILTAMAAGVNLVFNGLVVIRREGLRIATLVPAVFGCFLLTTVVAAFVAAPHRLQWEDHVVGLAAGMALVVILLGIIVAELVGYTRTRGCTARSAVFRPPRWWWSGAGLSGEGHRCWPPASIAGSRYSTRSPRPVDNRCWCSGGQGADEAVSEAAAMAGTRSSRVCRPTASSRRTPPPPPRRTCAQHLRRARRTRLRVVDDGGGDQQLPHAARGIADPAPRAAGHGDRRPTARYYVPAGFLREFTARLVHYRRLNLIAWSVLTALTWAFIGLVAYLSAQQTEVVDAALAMV